MHKSRLAGVVIDCRTDDLQREARFWAAALGREPETPVEEPDSKYVVLRTRPGEAQLMLQKVEHASRAHLDIETDDVEAEVQRLAALGAAIVERLERWVVMEAPSGQRFCVVRVQRSDFAEEANVWA